MATAILDGHYMVHRVMHVPQLRLLSTKDGKPTGGVFGTLKTLRSTINLWKEIRRVIMVFDGGRSKRRIALFRDYKRRKRNEEVDPDGLSYRQKFNMQISYLKFVLPKLGIKIVELQGREGDDVVGLLSRRLDDKLKIVVSDDKDMFQLVDEDVHVWRPMREERVTLSNFEEFVGCSKEDFILRKSCLGDSSDSIPGIKGVGPKTVDQVLEACGGIGEYPHEKFFETCMDFKAKKFQALCDHLDVVLRNYELIDISREEFEQEEIDTALKIAAQRSEFDVLAVKRVFTGLEFYSLVEDFNNWVTPFQMLR